MVRRRNTRRRSNSRRRNTRRHNNSRRRRQRGGKRYRMTAGTKKNNRQDNINRYGHRLVNPMGKLQDYMVEKGKQGREKIIDSAKSGKALYERGKTNVAKLRTRGVRRTLGIGQPERDLLTKQYWTNVPQNIVKEGRKRRKKYTKMSDDDIRKIYRGLSDEKGKGWRLKRWLETTRATKARKKARKKKFQKSKRDSSCFSP